MRSLLQAISLIVVIQLPNAYSQNCIRDEVAAALRSAGYKSLVPTNTDTSTELLHEGFKNLSSDFSDFKSDIQELLSPIIDEVKFLRSPGKSPCHPAMSCREIYENDPLSSSGYYWLQSSSVHLVRVYCDMKQSNCGGSKGWMRVISIDVSNTTHSCPHGLKTLLQPRRLCSMNIDDGGCSTSHLNVHGVEYSKVCGKIIGYQQKTPDGFWVYNKNRALTIDDQYVDGISLTHGRHPRHHIWTFAAALQEVTSSFPDALCPCTNIHNPLRPVIPPYVGNDYFCDTASSGPYQFRFYPYDPLWDGSGCGPLNTCCSFNNPPWFTKQLTVATRDNIEMRLCTDSGRGDEDITFEKLDIYVQ